MTSKDLGAEVGGRGVGMKERPEVACAGARERPCLVGLLSSLNLHRGGRFLVLQRGTQLVKGSALGSTSEQTGLVLFPPSFVVEARLVSFCPPRSRKVCDSAAGFQLSGSPGVPVRIEGTPGPVPALSHTH